MTKAAFEKIASALRDIPARRYRTITFTPDGTVIITCAETGKSASGQNLQQAEANFRRLA